MRTLENAVNENPNFRSLDRRTAELINEVTGSRLEYEKKKEVVDVCKAIEDMKKKAVEAALKGVEEEKAAALKAVEEANAALKEAVEEGKNKSIEQMLSKGRTPEAISDFCGYDIEEVRKVAEKMSSPA
jgi:aspartyl/asparaginyl-tRNA synthetase